MGKYEKKNRPSGGKYQRRKEKKGSAKIIAVLLGIAVLLAVVIMLFDGGQGQNLETGPAQQVQQEQMTEEAVQMQVSTQPSEKETFETVPEETLQTAEESTETQAAWFDYLFDRMEGREEQAETTAEAEEESDEPSEPSAPGPMGTKVQRMTYMEMASGDLVLVNEDYGYPAGMAGTTTLHDKASQLYHVEDIQVSVQPHVVEPLNGWIGAFSAETGNREVMVRSIPQDSQLPELHTGLTVALDTYHIETTMDGDEVYEQLAQTAWQYGFVRRWTADKTEVTGIPEQKWHFRYVGVPHSVIMTEEELCLEEYLEYLREYTLEKGALEAEYDGVQYEVYFCEGLEITVPLNRQYTVSGNNVDGFIVTVEMNG